ncbi:DUF222 domain-containing protein [Geodermatophilus sp. SYSU D00684]
MEEVAGDVSPLERALAGWLLQRPVSIPRLPVALLSDEQAAAELQRVQVRKAMEAAYEAELVLRLAEARPADTDPAPGSPGARSGTWQPDTELPGVSEFFTAELAVVLNVGRGTASHLAHRAWTYRSHLPATWAALAAGTLDEARAKALVDVLEHTTAATARRLESQLLPEATDLTVRRLKARALALLQEADADAIDARRETAQRHADVRLFDGPFDGMATLAADLPADVAAVCHAVVDALARMLKADGDPRPIGQLRTLVYADLLQRPWETGRSAVTAHLQVIATLSALTGRSQEAGQVNGLPITAGHLRELLRQLDGLGVRAPEGGSVTLALVDDGTLRATTTLDQLRRLAGRGCPDHPADADVEQSAGAGDDCECAVLDRPAETESYAPSAPQQRFVHTRDRTCRFPTCGQRVGWADADHVIPHAHGGATDCANLCCLCRSHHRLKTFAKGWRFQMTPDGVLTVTTPSGITRTTRPPGMSPPSAEPDPPPDTEPSPPDPADEPPPF